jgi:hypothetical protein
MTIREMITWVGDNPTMTILFFSLPPFTALVAWLLGRGEGHVSPWKYLYSVLVFMACIPGIFSVGFSVYLFLFERGSIMNTDVFTQILPIASMITTLSLVRRNVSYDAIPGFDRISSLMFMIGALIVVMWLLDRTHIVAFSYIPIHVLLLIVVGLLLLFRLSLKRFMS